MGKQTTHGPHNEFILVPPLWVRLYRSQQILSIGPSHYLNHGLHQTRKVIYTSKMSVVK